MSSWAELVEAFVHSNNGRIGTAGLFVTGSAKSVPLRLRNVSSTVHCDTSFADTTETFAFIADEDVSVEFKFPLPPRAAVYKLSATIGDRTISTEVKAKEQARQEFNTAVGQGHTAVIAQKEDSSQIFTLELGNLAAMEEALVEVHYLRLLDSVGGALEWVHTATWTPPYTGSAGDAARGAGATLQGAPRFAGQVAYQLAYDITLVGGTRAIKAVESPEAVVVTDTPADGGASTASKRVTLSETVADPSKDLTLLVELEPLSAATVAAMPGATSSANGTAQARIQECTRPSPDAPTATTFTKSVALATFTPSVLDDAPLAEQGAAPGATLLNQELILVVDCSGSMSGQRIEQAREAALYFIKDLPLARGIRFNIVAFGSGHTSWSSGCKEFNAESMASAVKWVQERIHADMGGTEILETFRAVYATPAAQGYTRQIIFLTDGGISGGEEAAVFQLVGDGSGGGASAKLESGIAKLKARVLNNSGTAAGPSPGPKHNAPPAVLCLGIGHGVHRGLLDGMASRSGGVAQYVVDGEGIVRKVGFLKKAALAGRSVVVAPRLVPHGVLVRCAPHVLPPRLFPGEPFHLLVELVKMDEAAAGPASLELTGTRGDGSEWSVSVLLAGAPRTQGEAYSVLHGMCWVGGLLSGASPLHCSPAGSALPQHEQPSEEAVRAEVVKVAVAEHLVTRHTAAVGVLVQKDPLDPQAVKKVEVPLAVPHGAVHFNAISAHAAQPASFGFGMPRYGGGLSTGTRNSLLMTRLDCCDPPSPIQRESCKPDARRNRYRLDSGGSHRSEEECDDKLEGSIKGMCPPGVQDRVMLLGAPPAPAPVSKPTAAAASPPARSPSDILALLNLHRDAEGTWADSDEVIGAVTSLVATSGSTGTTAAAATMSAARAARPAELSTQQWATVLALAFLRKHCAGEKHVWEGMEAKAMAWLQAGWPAGARALGFTVLAAMKLV